MRPITSENQYIQVTYVTGNHDLLSFEPATKTLIQRTFPEMVICSEEPGLGAYSIDEVLWAEHGHRYSLFNAPDTWSHDKSHLPLGYLPQRLQEYFPFKPRIVVFAVAATGAGQHPLREHRHLDRRKADDLGGG